MSVYDLHFNKDDVAIRNILVGFLATLSNNIHWYNQIGTVVNEKRKIDIPFYFSTTGSERYLQDNFLNNIDFDPENLNAEAFYNQIPRGIVNFESFSIDSQSIVNKYVRMQHVMQEDDGTLNTYNSEAYMVPIIMDITVDVYVDSIIDQLKCSEAIIRTFYKAKPYQVDISYTRIPCLIAFPDDYSQERTVEFSFTDKKEYKVTFTVQVKSHIPIFKPETTIFAGTNMASIDSNIYIPPLVFGPSGGGSDALLSNRGLTGPTGTFGASIRTGFKENSGKDYDEPNIKGPVWPINPSTSLPPE